MSKIYKNTNTDFEQILLLIQEARSRVYTKANAELVLLYFNVGKVVSQKVEAGNWGESTVQELANFIASKQPELSGFNRRGLYRMKQFYETYTNPQLVSIAMAELQTIENNANAKVSPVVSQIKKQQITKVSPVVTQLENQENEIENFIKNMLSKVSWSHHLLILNKAKTIKEKLFYLSHTVLEKLSKRELERQLNTAVYERTLLSNKLVAVLPTQLPQNLFKDPYIFEFLELPESHNEKDFEKAITHNLQKFILEIGKGFTYMGNQYRLQVGNKDYYTDLLFYHRDLQCLVLFELKIQEFEPEFIGKLNFYLEALDRDVKRPTENPSIGILLCKGKDTEVVEYAMARNTSPAIIADYETKLIDKKLLANKLHQLAELFNKETE
jgi:predicted nuclease of restriction endonuclease-like (RecB) superfamily